MTLRDQKRFVRDFLRREGFVATIDAFAKVPASDRYRMEITFDVLGTGLKFTDLDKLSRMFRTNQINVGAKATKGCSSCTGYEAHVVVEILNAQVLAEELSALA